MDSLTNNIKGLGSINVLYLSGNLVKFPGLDGDLTNLGRRREWGME